MSHTMTETAPLTTLDPVCGMSVDPLTTHHHADFASRTYHFCSATCRSKFVAQPLKYLGPAQSGAASDSILEEAEYTCPMHPDIRQKGPGTCPICGMALEPVMTTAEIAPNHELTSMTRRFWFGLALAVPVFALEMGSHITGLHVLQPYTSNWVQLALATPVVLWAGWPFFVRGFTSVQTRHLNMFTLIALGTGIAWL
jgi:P-type Cu+ transporter